MLSYKQVVLKKVEAAAELREKVLAENFSCLVELSLV